MGATQHVRFSARTNAPATRRRRSTQEVISEKELIRRAQAGDEDSFAALFKLHRRRVYWLCVRLVHDLNDAEDLTQEAFLQVFRKLHTFRGEAAFSTWLHQVTVNVVLMRLRKKHLTEVPLEDTPTGGEEGEIPVNGIEVADSTLAGSVDRITLERAIDELPPGYRLVFLLHDVQGYEHREVAEILDCSVGNTKSQLHKARLKLRNLLKHHNAEPETIKV